MSVSDRTRFQDVTRTVVDGAAAFGRLGSTLAEPVVGTVRAVAFWFAVLLPLTYLPLLATGVAANHPLGFAALLCSNAAAFVLGHTHEPERDDAEC
ncbi:hypothetical protein C2R22_17345 [Salinigranum rubrum]|uniref:Uncharacterized protein n=1 Tax=Salinigranum rubrum TaxID=755307 RepID=A0A2I8VMP6_9EURY|nr:hypothetical protein [Salinigranum rubrum]AUV83191.1 hypothetical protein C2R22_17345 [Salinigranum rubrum]